MVVGKSKGGVLRLVPASAQPQDQSAPRYLIQRCGFLGDHGWTVEGRASDKRANLDTLGHGCQRSHDRPRFPGTFWRFARTTVQKMIADPDRIVAERLGRRRHLHEVIP